MSKPLTPVEQEQMLLDGIHPRMQAVYRPMARDLLRAYREKPPEHLVILEGETDARNKAAMELVEVLRREVLQNLDRIRQLELMFENFVSKASSAASDTELRVYLLEFSKALGSTRWQRVMEQRAMTRWMSVEALSDRHLDEVGGIEQGMVFRLGRLGYLARETLEKLGEQVGYQALWKQMDLEAAVLEIHEYHGDSRVVSAAFECLVNSVDGIPAALVEEIIGDLALRTIYRSALDQHQDVWVQSAALRLLRKVSLKSFCTAGIWSFVKPTDGDRLFVRRKLVEMLPTVIEERPDMAGWLTRLVDDPSPHVRQAVARAAVIGPESMVFRLLESLCRQDPEPSVRAASLLALPEHAQNPDRREFIEQLLEDALRNDQDVFVLRVAIQVAEAHCRSAQLADPEFVRRVEAVLVSRYSITEDARARRHFAEALERFWCIGDPEASHLFGLLRERIDRMRPGHSIRLPKAWTQTIALEKLGRVLAVLAQSDFPLELYRTFLRRGWCLMRGDRMRPRFWRILHELRIAASDKREAYPHTVGRRFNGPILAPSGILGELSETKVPGEPLSHADEGSWRPYLPLPDHVLASLETGRQMHIYTAEGVTRITPPRNGIRQFSAWFRISLGFSGIARARNWRPGGAEAPTAYAEALRGKGVDLSIEPHATEGVASTRTVSPGVTRFFSITPLFAAGEMAQRLQNYFYSIYQNNLYQLTLFVGGITAWFIGRHVILNQQMRSVRRALPLVIGGWGTRGKSGTERLKAALLNGLGLGVMSKTSGCEAMFVYSRPFRPLREMFLFRPYDKATIWEQHRLTCMSPKFGSQVFLWECMGLTPSFIEVLQQHWMRDDIATITNTYPDHEDLQGPAGYNIPRVMTRFIPRRSLLVTTESEMLPILENSARRRKTRLEHVGWLQENIIAPDILARFPYEEHPANIALVLEVARNLGIDADFALKEMADRVVPDLGVLKRYPLAPYRGRKLEFVNGMSANERFGCIGNWERMQFDVQDYTEDASQWIMTVVNNRADREARSKVFANILANDLAADCHLLIGSNLEGLKSFTEDEWNQRCQSLSLSNHDTPEQAQEMLDSMSAWLRIPRTREHVQARINAMLAGLGVQTVAAYSHFAEDPSGIEQQLAADGVQDAEAFAAHIHAQVGLLGQLNELTGKLCAREQAPDPVEREYLDHKFRELLDGAFYAKLIEVEDYHASGDQVIDQACDCVPPGLTGRVMGLQNIKGTGLDFVYRWQAWERCHVNALKLNADQRSELRDGLQALASMPSYPSVAHEFIRLQLEHGRANALAQTEAIQAQMQVVESKLAETGSASDADVHRQKTTRLRRVLASMTDGLEEFMDAGDAVKRRRKADRIYRDLAAQRMGVDHAVTELQALNKRQKGGWLRAAFSDWRWRQGGQS